MATHHFACEKGGVVANAIKMTHPGKDCLHYAEIWARGSTVGMCIGKSILIFFSIEHTSVCRCRFELAVYYIDCQPCPLTAAAPN